MRWPLIIFWGVVLALVQSSAVQHVSVERVAPDMLLLLCLYVALYARRADVFAGAWFVGLMHDLYSQNPLGLQSLVYMLLALGVCLIRTEIFRAHMLTRMVLCALACVVVGSIDVGIAWAAHPSLSLRAAGSTMALAMAYTTLVCPVVFALFDVSLWIAGRRAEAALA